MALIMGIQYAAVLPDPVDALAMISFFSFMAKGMA